ncbi:hypothetical protein [Superficieibacter sp. 1612_C1]|nr:hypothetical protein [Superficieibacter sp. 1612_C1]
MLWFDNQAAWQRCHAGWRLRLTRPTPGCTLRLYIVGPVSAAPPGKTV